MTNDDTKYIVKAQEEKKYVKVFQPTKQCRLSLSELLVYSYGAYQQSQGDTPGTMKIVRGIGLCKRTVHKAKERLKRLGLWAEDEVQPPPGGMFITRKVNDKKKNIHWRDHYAYWHYYVRSPKSELSTVQIVLWTFLRHIKKSGLPVNVSSLSRLLRCDRNTIKYALATLHAEGVLTYNVSRSDGIDYTLVPLRADDMRHFQNVRMEDIEQDQETDPEEELEGFIEQEAEAVGLIPADDATLRKIERILFMVYRDTHSDRAAHRIRRASGIRPDIDEASVKAIVDRLGGIVTVSL